MFDDS